MAQTTSDLAQRIAALDWALFDAIDTQTTLNDRRSLLALHQACVDRQGRFSYLEIGSHLGGSLQVLIQDERCERIISIDSRPSSQPDERGPEWPYRNNSTARMRELLARIQQADLAKLETIDASTETLDPKAIGVQPALCFVYGEHTDEAVLSDAHFCRQLIPEDGWIAFHDTGVVYRGLGRFIGELAEGGVEHRTYFLPDTILVVELGEPRLLGTQAVVEQILDNAAGYLWTLHDNDKFRAALSSPALKLVAGLDHLRRRIKRA
jgi:hypothetical protein